MARREERAYREYVSDEQRSQPGCPARELCDESLLQDTRLSLLGRAPTSTRSRSALRKAANHGIPGICLVWRADRSRTRTRIACTAPARRRRGVLPPAPIGWHAGDRLRHHAGRAPTRARATTPNEAAPTTPPRDRGETPCRIVDRRIAPVQGRVRERTQRWNAQAAKAA